MIYGILALAFAILSARLGIPDLAYGVVVCTVVAVVLCAFGKLKGTHYAVYLFGLAFLLQTTLISDNLIGTDIHAEYYIYQISLDGWDMSYPHAYNTAIGSTLIAPSLTRVFGIPGYWIYKVIFPVLFSLVPFYLYSIFKDEFNDKIAFMACVVFVTLPTYLLEMIGLPRQMLGELMLAFIMFCIILRPAKTWQLVPMLIVCVLLGFLFHYVTGPIILAYLVCCLVVLLGIKYIGKYLKVQKVRFSLIWLAVIIILPSIAGFAYYAKTASGTVMQNYGIVTFWLGNRMSDKPIVPATAITTITPEPKDGYFEKQEPLIRTALGLDFLEADISGKVFRIVQFLAQLFIILGCLWIIKNRGKISPEFIAFVLSSLAMLLACILLPRFSNIINTTRFYHIALFSLAPVMILGGMFVFRNVKYLLIFMIPYILVMTGTVFEVSGQNDISKITAPYSIALSNYRLNVVGEFNDADKIVSDYVVDNKIEPVLTDINGMLLLSQRKNPYEYINRSPRTGKYYTVYPLEQGGEDPGQSISELHKGWGYLPQNVADLPKGTYIFLTSQSMETQSVIFKPDWYNMKDTASGMRVAYPFDYLGITTENIIFKSGNSVVLEVK